MGKKTLVIGASTNPSRYAYLASRQLLSKGHEIVLFGNRTGNVDGHPILHEFPSGMSDIDTVTLYIGPDKQPQYYEAIVQLHPKRIIFNPGTENPEFFHIARENGIEVEVACTLVMLSNGLY